MSTLIIGCGYVGRRLVRRYQAMHVPVVGVVRTPDNVSRLRAAGFDAAGTDMDRPPLPLLPLAGSDLFYLVPPPAVGEEDTRVFNLIEACGRQGHPRRIVYFSTTGVYGDCAGEWVDETRPLNPAAPRALRRYDAEQRLQAWRQATGGELVILRVAGIYGPGKLPLERLRKGLPLIRAEEAPFTNRIHVDDLVEVCVAAMERGQSGVVYNACDGHPSTMVDYFNQIADLAGLPHSPTIALAEAEHRLSPGMLSYMQESRRLRNRKLREELGVKLRYPSLAEGLPACFSADA